MDLFRDMIFDGTKGKASSMRFVFLVFGTLFAVAVVGVWSYLSIRNGGMCDIPSGVYDTLAILLLGKAIQRGVEAYGNGKSNNKIPVDMDKATKLREGTTS